MKKLLIALCLPLAVAVAEPKKPVVSANATNRFAITGMSCEGCAGGLQSELAHAKGVASARVVFTNSEAVVAFDTNRTDIATLLKVVEESGFKAKVK